MGAIGSAIGGVLGGMFPFFRKGGKVRRMANGGAVLDAQDKMAIKALNTLVPMRKGGKAKRKARK